MRPGLLEGVTMLVAGPGERRPGATAATIAETCAGLGARVLECALEPAGGEGLDDRERELHVQEQVEQALAQGGSVELLAVDGAGLFGCPGAIEDAGQLDRSGDMGGAGEPPPGRPALVASLQASWDVTRALATGAFLRPGRPGRIVYVAPAPGAGAYARAAGAGLENLARTLSVEWARHGITVVAIAPGSGPGAAEEAAALIAYLASPAGAYFSGCLLDLSGPARA